ncbi:choice-of-anchor L domain-containing protein [Actinomyces haliotis]|uniref:choice-of-anchor L domain-containing protein n=1 Tax=Actinomyces haliotis TaxID=1280843 RepID=UPI002B27621B|nr:choice-of-anchor L domain-containing protein [Actinomyces haliotis]
MNNSLPTARRGRALLPAVAAIAASLALAAPAVASDGQSASTLRDASTTNAQSLAQAIAGDATVSNAKVTGVDVQVGRVTGLPSKYFSQDSVALSTGSLIAADPQADSDTDFEYSSVLGPNQALDTTGDLGGDGDAALSTLVGDDTYDATTLEFDVVPTGKVLNLAYQFGSEEYAGDGGSAAGNPNNGAWESQGYGDVLSITVDGTECALVPGTKDLVSAATVNATTNAQYYTANVSGHDLGDIDTEMNGFTSRLECSQPVTVGKTAHVRIALADVLDGQLDSTVLLPAGGLTFSDEATASETAVPGDTSTADATAASAGSAEGTSSGSGRAGSATSTEKGKAAASSSTGRGSGPLAHTGTAALAILGAAIVLVGAGVLTRRRAH